MRARHALLVLLAAAGCSSIATSYDFDPGADFGPLKTYEWMAREADDPISPLVHQRVVAAGDRELAAKGYRRASKDPDFLMAAHGATQRRVDVTDWGYHRWGGVGGGVSVYEYEEGTLILDVVDARSKGLLWRGTARKVLATNPTPEQVTNTINEALRKMLDPFPPK